MIERVNIRRGGKGIEYIPANDSELTEFAAWVRALAQDAPDAKLAEATPPRGFEIETDAEGLWFLVEHRDHRRGAGVFVLRSGHANPWIVEAPHTFFDIGTLEIALTCFERLQARALLVNTLRRTSSEDDELEAEDRRRIARSGKADSDLAHAEQSFFNVMHAELIAQQKLLAIQLHGFRDNRVPDAAIVLSASGSELRLEPLRDALRELVLPKQVRLYPSEIGILGGMKNVQARKSRELGTPFLHIEIARSLRDRLREDSLFRQSFAEHLRQGLEASGTEPAEVKAR